MTTVCSNDSYIIHIASSESTDRTYVFQVINGASPAEELMKVNGHGDVRFNSWIVSDRIWTIQNIGTGDISRIMRGSSNCVRVHANGRTDFSEGGLVLFSSSSSTPSTPAAEDGDVYWQDASGTWRMRVYYNSGWHYVDTTSC